MCAESIVYSALKGHELEVPGVWLDKERQAQGRRYAFRIKIGIAPMDSGPQRTKVGLMSGRSWVARCSVFGT